MSEPNYTYTPNNLRKKNTAHVWVFGFCAVLFILCIFLFLYIRTPVTYSEPIVFEVENGMSVKTIADAAQEAGIVRSSFVLYVVLTQLHDPTIVQAGTYRFSDTATVFDVAQKLAQSEVDRDLIAITIPEGTTASQTAMILKSKLPSFDTTTYLKEALPLEGYLFPETYFIPKDFTPKAFIDFQQETYAEKMAVLQDEIDDSSFSEYEILTLASILEREANDEQSMRMVSGILQNRLNINMALQADASIEYILEKSLTELVPEDLEVDSPYNTYLYTGLTPTPIGNPGMQAIRAVLNPIESDYFYYITDIDGEFYYAETYEQHKKNIENYLR